MNIDPDALSQHDDPDTEDIHAGLPWNHCARFDGIPGMVWFSNTRKVRGDQLQVGDWLDSLDHRGARSIYGIRVAEPGSGFREVCFSGGWEVYDDGSSDTETVRDDVEYDVVDPKSQVTPDGTPVVEWSDDDFADDLSEAA